jgi:hypothetical protein
MISPYLTEMVLCGSPMLWLCARWKQKNDYGGKLYSKFKLFTHVIFNEFSFEERVREASPAARDPHVWTQQVRGRDWKVLPLHKYHGDCLL